MTPAPDLRGLAPPFVLLEDRLTADAPARLYRNPAGIVRCDDPGDVEASLRELERALSRGLHVAGFLAYELGYLLEPRLARRLPPRRDDPLMWFGLFEAVETLDPAALDEGFAALDPPPPIVGLTAGHDRDTHGAKVRRILDLIRAGDLYQANLTFPMRFRYAGAPLALYAALRVRQPVANGGVVAQGEATVLSVSPCCSWRCATAEPRSGR